MSNLANKERRRPSATAAPLASSLLLARFGDSHESTPGCRLFCRLFFVVVVLIDVALLLYSPPGADLSQTQPVGELLAAEDRQMTVYWSEISDCRRPRLLSMGNAARWETYCCVLWVLTALIFTPTLALLCL